MLKIEEKSGTTIKVPCHGCANFSGLGSGDDVNATVLCTGSERYRTNAVTCGEFQKKPEPTDTEPPS